VRGWRTIVTALGRNDSSTLPRPLSQKRCPTAFQLFPNAREIVLRPCERTATRDRWRLEVADAFRLPSKPADAAAARAALAGVTRLEVRGGGVEHAHLAAALLHLPGLRAVTLSCEYWAVSQDELAASEDDSSSEDIELSADLVAVLAACPSIESLDWNVAGWVSGGAWGGRRTGGVLGGVPAFTLRALCGVEDWGAGVQHVARKLPWASCRPAWFVHNRGPHPTLQPKKVTILFRP
jgi:hypothetical protein